MPETPERTAEHRVGKVEVAVEALRAAVSAMEREIGVIRADLERLRLESERAVGTRMP